MTKATTYDGYVRVSRVGGRSGSSYRSPSDQQAIIEQLARERGLELGEVVPEEDVSGKTPIDDRELGRLVRKIEDGKSAGLIVWRVTRYSRDFVDGVLAAERVRAAGGRIVGEDIDTSMPGSRGYLAMLLDIAENELDNRRATWKRATDGAIERGLHIGRVPLGYVRPVVGRNENTGKAIHGPLALDTCHPEKIEAVRFTFQERALGTSWGRIRAEIAERFGLELSRSSVGQMVNSRAYVGEVSHGDSVKQGAHPSIVTEAQWQAGQKAGKRPVRNGLVAASGVLHGLVFCQGCAGRMYTSTTGRKDVTCYACTNKRQARCPAPASVMVSKLDDYLLPMILKRIDTTFDQTAHTQREQAAAKALFAAEAELTAFVEHASAADLGELYGVGVTKRRDAIRLARTELDNVLALADQAGLINVGGAIVPIDPRNPEVWNALPVEKRREIAQTVVGRVSVKSAGRGGGRWAPLEERVEVTWR